MPRFLGTSLLYLLASAAEIAACFAFWSYLRDGRSPTWLLPGLLSLAAFAWLLTLLPSAQTGRALAFYGGVYVLSTLAWLWWVERERPDVWDMAGGGLALLAIATVLLAPRRA